MKKKKGKEMKEPARFYTMHHVNADLIDVNDFIRANGGKWRSEHVPKC